MTPSDQSICACGAQGKVTDTGSASGRKHYRCPACGNTWREKNAAAAALGALGGKASAAAMTPEARSARSEQASNKRWDRVRAAKNDDA